MSAARGQAGPGTRVFITGGASGLGRALAESWARAGWRVCIGDLNESRGAETVAALATLGPGAHFLRCDVTRDGDLEEAARWLEESWGGVDVVVNNAGVAVSGGIADVPLADWQWAVDVNLLGVVRGCRVFTPLLRRQGGGHLVNVASMAGLVHPPMMSAYNATKAAVVALSETLRLELEGDGIHVTVVCPGFFRTNLAESLRASGPGIEGVTRALVVRSRRTAPEIAELVRRGVERGESHVLTHGDGRVAWMLKRLLPFPLYLKFLAGGSRRMLSRRPEPRPGGPAS